MSVRRIGRLCAAGLVGLVLATAAVGPATAQTHAQTHA
jgi:hypothetical protein